MGFEVVDRWGLRWWVGFEVVGGVWGDGWVGFEVVDRWGLRWWVGFEVVGGV